MAVRGKFEVVEVASVAWSEGKRITLQAVTTGHDMDGEDARYHRYTPSGKIEFFVDNPPAAAQLVLGKKFYVDFTAAE
jgi:hypothetical protein